PRAAHYYSETDRAREGWRKRRVEKDQPLITTVRQTEREEGGGRGGWRKRRVEEDQRLSTTVRQTDEEEGGERGGWSGGEERKFHVFRERSLMALSRSE